MTDFCPTCGASWRCDCPTSIRDWDFDVLDVGPSLRDMSADFNDDGTDKLWDNSRAVARSHAFSNDSLPREPRARINTPTKWPAKGWENKPEEEEGIFTAFGRALEQMALDAQHLGNALYNIGQTIVLGFAASTHQFPTASRIYFSYVDPNPDPTELYDEGTLGGRERLRSGLHWYTRTTYCNTNLLDEPKPEPKWTRPDLELWTWETGLKLATAIQEREYFLVMQQLTRGPPT